MSRRGKYLTIHFNSGDNLVLHLRMTGQLLMPPLIIRWIVKHSVSYTHLNLPRHSRIWLMAKTIKIKSYNLLQFSYSPFKDTEGSAICDLLVYDKFSLKKMECFCKKRYKEIH